jgi:hypothetical protein
MKNEGGGEAGKCSKTVAIDVCLLSMKSSLFFN